MHSASLDRESLVEHSIPEACLQDLRRDMSNDMVGVNGVERRSRGDWADLLLDASWVEASSERRRSRCRTFVYFHRPGAQLPPVTIQSKKGFSSKLLLKLAGHAGLPDVPLPGREQLASNYAINSFTPDSARALLTDEFLDALEETDDLTIQFGRNGVRVSRAEKHHALLGDSLDESLNDAERDQLLATAWAVCRSIVEDPEAGPRAAQAVPGNYAQEATRGLRAGQGWIPGFLLSRTITREMVEQASTVATPRRGIPPQVKRKAWGGSTLPLLVTTLFNIVLPVLGVMFTLQERAAGEGHFGLLFFIPVPVSAIAGFLVLRWRLKRRRLLVHGTFVTVKVVDIVPTVFVSGNDRITTIHFGTEDGKSASYSVNVGSTECVVAERFQREGKPTRVLRHDKMPGKCLWLECWAIEEQRD